MINSINGKDLTGKSCEDAVTLLDEEFVVDALKVRVTKLLKIERPAAFEYTSELGKNDPSLFKEFDVEIKTK